MAVIWQSKQIASIQKDRGEIVCIENLIMSAVVSSSIHAFIIIMFEFSLQWSTTPSMSTPPRDGNTQFSDDDLSVALKFINNYQNK